MATAAKKLKKKIAVTKKITATAWNRSAEVPNFSEAAIYIADLCAREAWVGKSYETGASLIKHKLNVKIGRANRQPVFQDCFGFPSDENFLAAFGTELLRRAGVKNLDAAKNRDSITYHNFGLLLDAAKLNSAVNTKFAKLDIPQGINFLKRDLKNEYKKWANDRIYRPNPELAKSMVMRLSEQLCMIENGAPLCYQPAVASRLLNFGFPDLNIYNYSVGISSGLKLFEQQTLLDSYYELLDDGFQRNWHQLAKYEMPVSNIVPDAVWHRARNGGWWQRRIYDLALKMYFSDEDKNFFSAFSSRLQDRIFTEARSFPHLNQVKILANACQKPCPPTSRNT
jgi:hypothetical protein